MNRRKATRDMGAEPRVTSDFLDPLDDDAEAVRQTAPRDGISSTASIVATMESHEDPAKVGTNAIQGLIGKNVPERLDVAERISESDISSNPDEEPPPNAELRTLHFEFYDAKLPEVDSEVAFAAYYLGANLMASALDFNQKFRKLSDRHHEHGFDGQARSQSSAMFSLERFVELGIMAGNLGALTLFPIPFEMRESEDRETLVLPEYLMMGGLGEPGSLTRDDVRFVMTNVVYSMKALRKTVLSTHLIGIHSRSLNIRQSLRAIVEGIKEGMERFDVKELKLKVVFESSSFPLGETQIRSTIKYLESTWENEIRIVADPRRLPSIYTEADAYHKANMDYRSFETGLEDNGEESDDATFTRLTVTADNSEDILRAMQQGPDGQPPTKRWKDLKYSALTSNSAIPTRTVQIQNSFAEMLPNTVLDVRTFMDQWEYGNLMMHCLVPDDFQKIIEEGEKLTLVVDRETARIPWEMAGFNSKNSHKFFGTDLEISRQFRSIVGCTNAHPPELNQSLRILLIADPVRDELFSLEGAVDEAVALTEIFARAQEAYGDRLDVHLHVRIGNEFRLEGSSSYRQDSKERFRSLKRMFSKSGRIHTDFCRPIEILKLLVHEKFDIVHFAGHGRFVPETGEMGWMLDSDCTLTAKEIFRVRQVPRLVFANACRSGEVKPATAASSNGPASSESTAPAPVTSKPPLAASSDEILENLYRDIALFRDDLRKKVLFGHMSMAEAFFARGIPNFLGTGWNVDDRLALQMSTCFYRHLLGIDETGRLIEDGGKTIGEALKLARKSIGPDKSRLEAEFETHEDEEGIFDHPRDRLDHEHSIHNTWGAYQHYGVPTDRIFLPLIDRHSE